VTEDNVYGGNDGEETEIVDELHGGDLLGMRMLKMLRDGRKTEGRQRWFLFFGCKSPGNVLTSFTEVD
jgi:hypothetical protein